MIRKARFFPLISALLLLFSANYALAQAGTAQTGPAKSAPGYTRLQSGLAMFQEGRWRESVAELRRARAEAMDRELKAEALYWIALAEISAGDYAASLKDMDDIEIMAPASGRLQELPYHKGRALYYLGRYDEAIMLLQYYADGIGGPSAPPPGSDAAARKSAALYWLGECLYAMGQIDYAKEFFTIITEEYPQSTKFEAASYRLGLISQKKIEEELLYLLKWSHEESLKTIEEYQRRERSYDQALIAYQKRIAELGGSSAGPEFQPPSAPLPATPSALPSTGPSAQATIQAPYQSQPSISQQAKNRRLQAARASAAELNSELTRLLEEGNK
jgi:tetratricopeptide (TPR) repeat protein